MIVGTAGHIDHGKTALVQALTGVNADRLPEEKRRGITIELGYAAMALPDGTTIGFVDVPGHEKLVRTMVAGASGIDFALLLVAADDGVMPQTIEHLTILSLLGVRRGAAVITKADRADAALLAQRQAQATALLAQAGTAHWPVLTVSAHRGDGMDALRSLLAAEAAAQAPGTGAAEGFRMGLDRVFTLDGIGTVVAGSIAAGTVRTGDMLCLAQAPTQLYRVRSLHSHNRSVEVAQAGQRCAIGLAGLERSQVGRGQTLCDPAIALSTQRLDVWLEVAPTEGKPLRSGTHVHLHVGTQDTTASVAVLGQAGIAPGQGALAQIVAHQPVQAWHGDRFVLRDASATRTVAGGMVLDAYGLARYRQTPERLAYLASQREPTAQQRLAGALASAPFGIHAVQWLRQSGLCAWPFEPADVPGAVFGKGREWAIATGRLAGNEAAVLAMLADFHTRLPEDIGPDIQRARRLALTRMPEALWAALLDQMAGAGRIARRGGFIHLPEHGAQLREAERIVAQRALPLLLEGRFDPPWVRDIAGTARLPEGQVRSVLARLARGGEVFQVVRDLYYHPQVVQQLADLARGIEAREGQVVAASFRDATGLGRKRAIQILEFFDRIGFLRRVGDTHLLRPGTPLFPPGSKP